MLQTETVHLLADIGIMASTCGMSKRAFAIYNGIEAIRPKCVFPDIGLALEFINRKDYQKALDILEKKALKKNPNDPFIQALVGMILMFDGQSANSETLLKKLEKNSDVNASTMASELLKELRE